MGLMVFQEFIQGHITTRQYNLDIDLGYGSRTSVSLNTFGTVGMLKATTASLKFS